MKYYLLSKYEFSSLYKFGTIHTKLGCAIECDDPREAVKTLFSQSDSFEYAQEMLILSSENGELDSLNMFDVLEIYPLDAVSKNLMVSQFNRSLIFKEPIFQDLAEDFIQNAVMRRETINGISALRSIFNLSQEEDSALVEEIIRGKSLLRKWRKYYDIPLQERTPYSMLIAYNRYRHYPKDLRGFFYDASDCFMYATLNDKEDFLGFDKDIVADYSPSYQRFLETIPSDAKFKKVTEMVEESGEKICEAIGQVYGSVRFMALYFYFKDRILTEETLSLEDLHHLYRVREQYSEDFPRLITLLGGFLGYSWIYDRYYEFTKRPFLSTHHDISEFETKAAAQLNEEETSDLNADTIIKGSSNSESALKTIPTEGPEETGSDAIDPSHSETQPNHKEACKEKTKDMTSLFELDKEHIIKVLFPRKSDRRAMFIASLDENNEKVLGMALRCDEKGLEDIYPELDKRFKKTQEKDKPSVFAKACLNLKPIGQSLFSNQD